ncbi:MAG: hypothetical protein EOO68_05610 [Moraxellaceae bacterium]|nr:MAG: hypothetical protein EOO68_05610 [Moraxellaceae bacterium]
MPKFHQTVIISTVNGNGPLDAVDVLNQLNTDAIAYHVRGETTGIIYYGNNYFLNYVESGQDDVEQHRQDALDYPYYHATEIRYKNKIHQRKFNTWRMRYTHNDPLVQAFLKKHGWQTFNPYLLEGELMDEFLAIIMTYADADTAQAPQSLNSRQNPRLWPTFAFGTVALLVLVGGLFLMLRKFNSIPFLPM